MSAGRRFDHGATDSTNERAFASLAAGEARHGDVHVARSQSAGRGRLGRRWESAPDEGLYLSMVLLPASPPDPVALTLAAGLAALDAVRALGLARARLDWPNDLVVDGAKLAGVLVEGRGGPGLVLGVGLNVRQRDFSPELAAERPVTSLLMEGLDLEPGTVERALVAALEARLDQAGRRDPALATDFLEATGLAGQEVRVRLSETELTGTCAGIDLARGLAVDRAGGRSWAPLAHVRGVERA